RILHWMLRMTARYAAACRLLPADDVAGRLSGSGLRAAAVVFVEDDLAQAEVLGGNLEALVVVEELQALFQRELPRRREQDRVVGGVGAHVGELLALGDVDHQVAGL